MLVLAILVTSRRGGTVPRTIAWWNLVGLWRRVGGDPGQRRLLGRQVLVVDAHVARAFVAAGKAAAADVAGERLLAGVGSHVRREVVAAAEGPPADGARERPLPGVNAQVARQLVAAREPAVARLGRAGERAVGDRRAARPARVLPRLHRHQRGAAAEVLLQTAHVRSHVRRPATLSRSLRLQLAKSSGARSSRCRQLNRLLLHDRHIHRRRPSVAGCRNVVAAVPDALGIIPHAAVARIAGRLSPGLAAQVGTAELERARGTDGSVSQGGVGGLADGRQVLDTGRSSNRVRVTRRGPVARRCPGGAQGFGRLRLFEGVDEQGHEKLLVFLGHLRRGGVLRHRFRLGERREKRKKVPAGHGRDSVHQHRVRRRLH